MQWSDFYDRYIDWAESTIISRVSSLENIGTGTEVIEVLYELSTEKNRDRLIRKAIALQAKFSQEDFIELEGEVSEAVYRELASYTGYDGDDPSFNEDNLIWDDFYDRYTDWSEQDLFRRIEKLKGFGPGDEVCEAVLMMPNDLCKFALCKKALKNGVKFSDKQLWEMEVDAEGNDNSEEHARIIEERIDDLFAPFDMEEEEPARRKVGFFRGLISVLSTLEAKKKARNTDNCNNQPPHYGYRYGRWYYGRGHRHACQKGGSGAHPKRTFRD